MSAALPMRAGRLPVAELIDLYMAGYVGKDTTRAQRMAFWRAQLGAMALEDVNDDHVFAAVRQLKAQPGRFYAGRDFDGKPIYKARRGQLTGATINRYLAALAACFTWAIRQRIAPAGYAHPVRSIERERESPGRTRFLSPDERDRLLAACKASKWPRLYLFVILGISTGARRGELLGLRWRNVDLARRVLYIEQSKNSDKKVLPLVPAAIEQLQQFAGAADALVFPSRLSPDKPMAVEDRWRQALKAAQIRGITVHGLRHTAASYLAQGGASALEIADLLGQRTLAMAKRYAHLNSGHRQALVDRVMGDIR